MKFYILAALVSAASAGVLPAGIDPAACPNYPYCSVDVPAALPTPVVYGQPVAPVLNTVPEQTAYYQQASSFTFLSTELTKGTFPLPQRVNLMTMSASSQL